MLPFREGLTLAGQMEAFDRDDRARLQALRNSQTEDEKELAVVWAF